MISEPFLRWLQGIHVGVYDLLMDMKLTDGSKLGIS